AVKHPRGEPADRFASGAGLGVDLRLELVERSGWHHDWDPSTKRGRPAWRTATTGHNGTAVPRTSPRDGWSLLSFHAWTQSSRLLRSGVSSSRSRATAAASPWKRKTDF